MKRAIGITRVSSEGDRETIHSYATQAARIEASCKQDGLELLYVGQERNVSGGTNLANRPELSRAVEAIEAGQADVIVAAYFDRFFRSLETQGEVVRRVEAAGGDVLTLDHGMLTNATPAKRLEAHIVGAMAQFFKEQTSSKVKDAHRAAVAAGKIPYPIIPLGYQKGADGVLQPHSTSAIVVELFERRAAGESLHSLARWMTSIGHPKSTTGIRTILKSRVYLGELHFGELSNPTAHEPIVSHELFDRAQRGTGKPGRPPLGEPRLLARLGLLKCACGASMALGSSVQVLPLAGQRTYYLYKCGRNPRCLTGTKVSIQAHIAETVVLDAVRDALRDAQGHASIAESAQDAASRLASAQVALDAYLDVLRLSGAENEPNAVENVTALKQARDDAQAELDSIPTDRSLTLDAAAILDGDDLDAKRDLIRLAVQQITVAPAVGYGRASNAAGRVTIQLRS